MLQLGNRREFFWDDYLLDQQKTTARLRAMQPACRGTDLWIKAPSDVNSTISYPQLVRDPKGWRMYYLLWTLPGDGTMETRLCVLESPDGKNWSMPEIADIELGGLENKNVVMKNVWDGMYVFYDPNPACPPEEKYKAVGLAHDEDIRSHQKGLAGLWCYTSPDGYRFTRGHLITRRGTFDSLNTLHYHHGRYICYFRNFHNIRTGDNPDEVLDFNHMPPGLNEATRDVRVMFSDDFKTWSEPTLIQFDDDSDPPLYTNCISLYERGEGMFVGFPTRYCERTEWTPNTEQFASNAVKTAVAGYDERRSGLAVTDCVFMCSRDGRLWHKYSEAFMTPGVEQADNWVYGDCYPAPGLVDSGADEYWMYTIDYHRSYRTDKPLVRWAIRKDGFACLEACGGGDVAVTKPLTFIGSKLHLNFSTSAYGYIFVDLLDADGNEIPGKTSFEVYGDTVDRAVFFADGSDFAQFA
ncbi:MAG: hypothetical protein IJC25_04055, partial [Clostridia bacterium]|nr:hypothetical protein [Clostridia bacterium]